MAFEASLQRGLSSLSVGSSIQIRFEELVADPAGCVRTIYEGLQIPEAESAAVAALALHRQRMGYRPSAASPPPAWRERIAVQWADLFTRYGYERSVA